MAESVEERQIIKECNNYIETLVTQYKELHLFQQERDLLIGENNIEKRDIKGYHGREILELLQNADDAYQKSIDDGQAPNDPLEVHIKYVNNIFSITNTGTVFDKDGIKAIVQGNNSPKSGKYIGNKGTGFRSILNWAKKVRILSGGYNIMFSKENADLFLESIRNEPQIEKQLIKNKKLYVPMLSVPQNLTSSNYNDSTTIEIEIDEEKQNDNFSVQKQLDSIDVRILLFLPNISKISITTDEKTIIYQRNIVTDNKTIRDMVATKTNVSKMINIEKYENDNSQPIINETFYVFDKTIKQLLKEDDILKDVLLSVAIPTNFDTFRPEHIYCFFPLLATESPFHCLLHASYELTDNRNSITYGDKNTVIIQEQFKFLIEIAKIFITIKDFNTAYKILIPENYNNFQLNFPTVYKEFNLESFYIDLLSKEKIFKTVNEELISVLDTPKVFDNGFPSFYKGTLFNQLITISQKEPIFNFFLLMAQTRNIDCHYKESELVEIINSLTDKWSIKEQVSVFIWWNENKYFNTLPRLLKTQADNYLSYKDECYFLIGDFNNIKLPEWVKVPSLRKDYQEELLLQSSSLKKILDIKEISKEPQISRVISQNDVFPDIIFRSRDRSNIISAVNSSIRDVKQSIEFVTWLWDTYHADLDWMPPGRNNANEKSDSPTIKYKFPDLLHKETKESDFFYFGGDYNNELADSLFDDRYSPLPSPSLFSIDTSEINNFKIFMRKFGVVDFPIIEKMTVTPKENYANQYEQVVMKWLNSGAWNKVTSKWELPFIKNLEDILQKLPESHIIRWINEDNLLFENLHNNYCDQKDIRFEYKGNTQFKYWPWDISKFKKVENYILFVFNEMPWIDINGEKYSPKRILQHFKETKTINKKFSDVIPVLTMDKIQEMSKVLNISIERIKDIYNIFSFCEDITSLSSEDFYGLLLQLPDMKNISHSEDLSRSIYRILERPETLFFEDSKNKQLFLKTGKLLVKYKGKIQYYLASETYVPSTKILNKKDYPIVEKGSRTRKENFINLLGCKEYKKEYEIISDSEIDSDLDYDFQIHLKNFLRYAKAYKENYNIANKINTLTIKIVKSICVNELENDTQIQNKVVVSEDYTFLRSSPSKWYIILSKDTTFMSEINSISEIIESIFDNIANTPGFESYKLGELFRARTNEDRDFLIKKEFGSLSILTDDNQKSEIQISFESTLKQLVPSYKLSENELDFENFTNNDNTKKIIQLFKELKIDIKQFEEAGFSYLINIIPYYKEQATTFIHNERQHFKNVLFKRAKDNEELQKDFLKLTSKFENFVLTKYENSVYYSPETTIINYFSSFISNWYEESAADIDLNNEYSKNYEELNPEKLYEEDISNDLNVQRMIYFNKKEEFDKWILEKQTQNNPIQKSPTDIYKDKRGAVPNRQDLDFSKEPNSTSEQNPMGATAAPGRTKGKNGAYSKRNADKKQEHQKEIGNIGELVVYNLLCKQYGKQNVFPRSEAFVTLGILKPGQANSSKYDLSYKTPNGTEYFVEVKSGNKNRFFISPEELEFAKANAKHYELYIVYNLQNEKPDYSVLPPNFWEDKRFKKTEIIEKIEYNF